MDVRKEIERLTALAAKEDLSDHESKRRFLRLLHVADDLQYVPAAVVMEWEQPETVT